MITAPQKLLIRPDLKNNNFDLLRLALAILVLYSHCFVIFSGSTSNEPGARFTGHQIEWGTLSVYAFLAISGFLILRSFDHSTSTRSYFGKRILRICPGFAVAFLFSILVAGPLGTIDAAHPAGNWSGYFALLSFKRLFLDLFTLQSPHAPGCFETLPLIRKVNSSMWTIQHEALCYLLVPILAAAGLLRKKRVLVIAFCTAFLATILLQLPLFAPFQNIKTKLYNYPAYLPIFLVYFLAGSAFYCYRHRVVRSPWLALLCGAVLLLTARLGGLSWVLPFAGTYLLFYAAFHPRFTFPHFARHGDLSYGTYLYAWPVQQLTLYLLKDRLGINGLFLISLTATLALAFLSWHFIERPFLRLKEKKAATPVAVPAVAAVY